MKLSHPTIPQKSHHPCHKTHIIPATSSQPGAASLTVSAQRCQGALILAGESSQFLGHEISVAQKGSIQHAWLYDAWYGIVFSDIVFRCLNRFDPSCVALQCLVLICLWRPRFLGA